MGASKSFSGQLYNLHKICIWAGDFSSLSPNPLSPLSLNKSKKLAEFLPITKFLGLNEGSHIIFKVKLEQPAQFISRERSHTNLDPMQCFP